MKDAYIVITTIFPPTKPVLRYSRMRDKQLIVVGDLKTPSPWRCKNVFYLSLKDQERLGYDIFKSLPLNHYSRKMIGYIYSIRQGAECIIDTDDDNAPKRNWCFPAFEGNYSQSGLNKGFVNVYKSFTDLHIWPRGFPLKLITQKSAVIRETDLRKKPVRIGVWQGLADDDPDVDAIYRLTSGKRCFFRKRNPIVLAQGTVCPINSQNTAFAKSVFPLLYLPALVNFRFTDIMRGLVAQPILWRCGYAVGFTGATVVQKRNIHDYARDFKDELPMYLNAERIIEIVDKALKSRTSFTNAIWDAYDALSSAGIVPAKELSILSAWLRDIEKYH